jgi:rhodanese-related sulfurtransferase
MNDAPRISAADARELLDAERAILLDTNPSPGDGGPTEAIVGACPAPPSEVGGLVRRLPRGCMVIAYCSCPGEQTSARAASLLREHGYEAVALAGGIAAWRDAGFPVEPRGAEAGRGPGHLCPACGQPSDDHADIPAYAVAPI